MVQATVGGVAGHVPEAAHRPGGTGGGAILADKRDPVVAGAVRPRGGAVRGAYGSRAARGIQSSAGGTCPLGASIPVGAGIPVVAGRSVIPVGRFARPAVGVAERVHAGRPLIGAVDGGGIVMSTIAVLACPDAVAQVPVVEGGAVDGLGAGTRVRQPGLAGAA